MKTSLRFLLLFLFVSGFSLVHAQPGNGDKCTVDRVGIQITSSVVNGTGCTVTANVFFVAEERNGGQKFFNVHLWEQGSRPAGLDLSDPLSPAQLSTALRNIVIEDMGQGKNVDWKLSREYNKIDNNPNVDISNVNLLVFRPGPDRVIPEELEGFRKYTFFVLENVQFNTSTSCGALDFVADVTGSNSAQNQKMQCFNSSLSVFNCQSPSPNYQPTFSGGFVCSTPNTFTITADNSGGCYPYYIIYEAYVDLNGNGTVDNGEPKVSGDPTESFFVLFPGETKTSKPRQLPANAAGQNLLMTNIVSFTADATSPTLLQIRNLEPEILENDCQEGSLPVTFKSFNAGRKNANRQQVELSWETATEQNNKGFHVQRKVANTWETIGFVFSATENGNSTETQRYSFVDNNNASGISQYRLLQEDFDGRGAYSVIKSVRGVGLQSGLVVYPNPAANGKATLLFADVQTSRDVMISDMSGRVVKQFREVADNTLSIEGLAGGFYTIRVVDKKANTVEVAKLVVQ